MCINQIKFIFLSLLCLTLIAGCGENESKAKEQLTAITEKLVIQIEERIKNGSGDEKEQLDEVINIVKKQKVGESGFAFVLDEEFNYVYHPYVKESYSLQSSRENFQSLFNQVEDNGSGFYVYSWNGVDKISYFYKLSNDYILAVGGLVEELSN